MKHLLVEGWRGISQSFAMVNQYQLYELANRPGLMLRHRDLPFEKSTWNTTDNNPGFPERMRDQIMAIPPPDRDEFDCVYSIASPFRKSATRAGKVITFMTGEFGLRPDSFVDGAPDFEFFCGGANEVVVPSRWSKMKLMEAGFPEAKVAIVPHGVNADFFSPLSSEERAAARQQIGVKDESFIFLNLGAMTWNKGLDVLVRAFAEVRKRHPNARLVLKDDHRLYGIAATNVIHKAFESVPELFDDDLRASIILLSDTLTLGQMRLLYGMADTYDSAYRAEGFNLPVIEAMACGTPVIVTAGGATDDFCPPLLAKQVASRQIDCVSRGIPGSGYYLEPSPESLVHCMEAAIAAPTDAAASAAERKKLMERYSWSACTGILASLF